MGGSLLGTKTTALQMKFIKPRIATY
jgi:hypothetical protein